MFTHRTILFLRPGVESAALLPVRGHFRDYHFARNVMEVKQYLLRCLHNMCAASAPAPDVIVVDADNNHDIKLELEQWMEPHPRLRKIKVIFPPPRPWVVRLCERAVRMVSTLMPDVSKKFT
jgi:hypothetical protein